MGFAPPHSFGIVNGSGSFLIPHKTDADQLPVYTNTKRSDTLLLLYPHQFWSWSENELVSFGSHLCWITSALRRVDASDSFVFSSLQGCNNNGKARDEKRKQKRMCFDPVPYRQEGDPYNYDPLSCKWEGDPHNYDPHRFAPLPCTGSLICHTYQQCQTHEIIFDCLIDRFVTFCVILQTPDLANANATEDDKISAMMKQSVEPWPTDP